MTDLKNITRADITADNVSEIFSHLSTQLNSLALYMHDIGDRVAYNKLTKAWSLTYVASRRLPVKGN